MEPLDHPKNKGTSRRRISSILKAPRTPGNFSDQEHVEIQVEVPKPVEKRKSRRVSFAPATDVLLFSKEKKNGSPVRRSPLQDLSAVNNPDNRQQMGVIENGVQPITDMESLLNAPLHSCQQRNEIFTVSQETADDHGEITMMFTANDASMDVTHSHTVIITDDSDLPNHNGETLSSCGGMDLFFSADRGKAEPCILPKTTSSSMGSLDLEFTNLLASISKPVSSRGSFMLHKMENKAPITPQDKENWAPAFMSTKMEVLSHKIGESSNRSVVLPEDTEGMEMTDVFTGHIVDNVATDEPLQCLFPTVDMYRQAEHRESSNPNGTSTAMRSVADSKKHGMAVPALKMGNLNLSQACPVPENGQLSQTNNAQNTLHLGEYANCKTSESEVRSQTVAIDSRSLHAVTTLTKQQQEVSRSSIMAPNNTTNGFDNDMDLTGSQTGIIVAKHLGMVKPSPSLNAGGSVRLLAVDREARVVHQGEIWNNPSEDDMEFTTCHTIFDKKNLDVPGGHVGLNKRMYCKNNKGINRAYSLGEVLKYDDCGSDDMEVTRSQRVVIDSNSLSSVTTSHDKKVASLAFISAFTKACNASKYEYDMEITKLDTNVVGGAVSQREGLEHYCESDDMETTKCQTLAIEAKSLNTLNPLESRRRKSLAFMTAVDNISQSSDLTMTGRSFFSKMEPRVDTDMELTRSQTRLIEIKPLDVGKPSLRIGMDEPGSRREGLEHYSCESDDMETTKCQTVAIEAKSLNTLNPLESRRRKSLAFMTAVDNISQSSDLTMTGRSLFSKIEPRVDTDMELTSSQTRLIEIKPLDVGKPSLRIGMDEPGSQREGLEHYSCESDDMETTKSQTVAIEAKSLNTLNPLESRRQKSLAFMTAVDNISQSSDLTMTGRSFFSKMEPKVDTDMELTRSQTRLIEIKPLDVGKPSLRIGMDEPGSRREGLEHYSCESDDMEKTKSQTVAIEAKSLNTLNPLESRRQKSLAFMTAVDNISQSSDLTMTGRNFFSKMEPRVDTDMELTRSQTRLIEIKPLDVGKPSLRIGMDESGSRREGLEHYCCESDDMETTKIQTVAIEAKSLNTLNPLESRRRKSLAFVTASAEPDDTLEDRHRMDKVQTEDDADSDMEFTGGQTRLIETNLLAFVTPSLKIGSGRSVPMLDSNTNAVENTKCFQRNKPILSTNAKTIMPKTKQETYSEDMELTRCQTDALNCEITGVPNIMFHKAQKSVPLLKAKTTEMDATCFVQKSLGSLNSDELEITSNAIAIESNYACVPDYTSVKLESLEIHSLVGHSRSAGALGLDLKNGSHESTNLRDVEMTHNRAIPITLNQEAATLSTSTLSIDDKMATINDRPEYVDASHNALKSKPLSEDEFGHKKANEKSHESMEMQNKNGSEEHRSPSSGEESSSCTNAAAIRADNTCSPSTWTRQMSLANLQRRLSHLMNKPTKETAIDTCDAPLAQTISALNGDSDKSQPVNAMQDRPEKRMAANADDTQSELSAEEDQPCVTAPLNLRKSLTSRLSLGSFLPKLPQKIKPVDSNKVNRSGRTSIIIDNIVDEVCPNLSSDEDLSETLVTETPQVASEGGSPIQGPDTGVTLEEIWNRSPDAPSVAHGKKRLSPVDREDMTETEKRRRSSLNSTLEILNKPPEAEEYPSASNSSSTIHFRSEATFESTLKQSLFESQLEDTKDCTNAFQKKLNDDRITVLEFFKLFNIDFVIHTPRQSVLPGRLSSDQDHTPEELLKNRHINHPKQRVYELDHQNLAQQVDRLKDRMQDRERLLHSVNKPLWDELRGFSEKELKHFGAKLKERCHFFRKESKVQSHEMKEALYSKLLQAHREEQRKLLEKMEAADGMLNSLDDCIQQLETELAEVEPTVKSSQLGLETVAVDLADKERNMCELEMEKKCNMDKVKRLQSETQDLNDHITMLHRVNEWRVAEKMADRSVFSFLFETLHIEVVLDKCTGKGPEEKTERNILDINFKLELDEEKSQCHARLVHKLLSEYTEGGSAAWVHKYPSNKYIPHLLHDVGLVVSRCRLLGEEVRLLKTWGGLRLDILEISCVDTRVSIVFSSLKAMAKFELAVEVTTAYPISRLQVQDFKNHIGSTTAHHIEEIVSSVSPGKNYLTKIVKDIHTTLLS